MVTEAQKAAAACARAARWPINLTCEPSATKKAESPMTTTQICVNSDSDDKCRYTGGVNVCVESDWQEEAWEEDESDEQSDTESLAELEGEELEANLQALRPELPDMNPEEVAVTMPYEAIGGGKSAKTFSKAEKNHGLGYNSFLSIQNNCMTRKHKIGLLCVSRHKTRECNG